MVLSPTVNFFLFNVILILIRFFLNTGRFHVVASTQTLL